ncbi:MAG TPA: DUF1552 domain-containing protein [Nannocystaceae bacterium]|nr:DUF1552 domain-containing protein [Nannocystaceae bacterium]
MKSFRLSRRAFLGGGAGVMIGLPLLEVMSPTAKAADPPPKRFVAVYVPCGIHMQDWIPSSQGTDYTLPLILEPLAALKDDILVLSGIDNRAGEFNAAGDHARGTGCFLSCSLVNLSETDITNTTTIDQLYAQSLGAATPLTSLQLGTEGGDTVGNCDSGYSCAYARNISWVGNTPIPKLTNPETAFDLLFAGFDPGATAAELLRIKTRRLSVLDYATSEANTLQSKLGTSDKIKVQEYLDSVRDLELRVQAESTQPQCELGTFDLSFSDFQQHVTLMSDIMVKAMQCDRTRAITFMMDNAGSNRDFGDIGAGGGHHNISHHNDLQENFDKLKIIDRWEVERLAYLLQAMKDAPEGEGTLLSNSVVFFGSEIADGNAHGHRNMPIVLAGQLGGTITTGKHIAYPNDTQANLFLALLDRLGVDVATYGDEGTAPLGGLS